MLINRYIFRQTASALLTILIALTLIVWLTSLLREIKLLTSQGQTFILFLKITALAIPNLLVTVAPVAFLIASLHTLNRLNGDSEIIVLSAAGASVWRLLLPYFFLAMVVFAVMLVANLYTLPAASRLLQSYVAQVRADVLTQVLQPGEFSELERGLTVHVRERAANGDLLGVVVNDERDPKAVATVLAERGQVVSDGKRAAMELTDGQVVRQTEGRSQAQIVVYNTYTFDIGDFTQKDVNRDLQPRERDIEDLLFPKEKQFYEANKARFRAEIHERFSTPLYAPLFALLAVLYLGQPRTTRESRTNLLFTAFAVGALFRIFGIAAVNLAAKQTWAVFALYGVPVAGILLCVLMFSLNKQPPALALPAIRLGAFGRLFQRRGDPMPRPA
jgi:lipopolysaccharide export system permease protein